MKPRYLQPDLRQRLEPVVRQVRIQRALTTLAVSLIVAAAAAWGVSELIVRGVVPSGGTWIVFLAISLPLAAIATWLAARSVDLESLVAKLEARFPSLNAALLTALEQEPDADRRFTFFQQGVIRQAIYHSYREDWSALVPRWRRWAVPFSAVTGLLILSASVIGLALAMPPRPDPNQIAFRDAAIVQPTDWTIRVEPGDTEVEKGSSLLVLARFDSSVPAGAELVARPLEGEPLRIPMQKSLADPVFAARIPNVDRPFEYEVVFDEQVSDAYRVSVFEYPELLKADVDLNYPEYTGLPPVHLEDVRRVSAVQGTHAEFELELNKPVAQIRLESADGGTIELVSSGEPWTVYRGPLRLDQPGSTRFQLSLLDEQGRTNQDASELVVNVLENGAPKLKVTRPGRDTELSALEEMELGGTVWDDFGVTRAGIAWRSGDQEEQERVLLTEGAGRTDLKLSTLLEMEKLGVEEDQLLSYYFWVEDIGPDGNPRRSDGELYFATIRPFDEIYRQGQAGAGGGAGGAGGAGGGGSTPAGAAAQELAELQRQIVSASWNVIRRQSEKADSALVDDAELLRAAQQDVMDRLDAARQALAGNPANARGANELADARLFMEGAARGFESARDQNDPAPLEDAHRQSRLASQALLKLRDREQEVARMNRQQAQAQGQPAAGARQQQQLNQLELSDDDVRYEEEREAAASQETPEQRENRQILNRLKELARRQSDLNERIKDLQSALSEADSEEEREELEAELKRLRDEQRKIVEDLDSLQERMQQSENQQQLANPAEQVQQARENAQSASQALSESQLSRAAAEGTRAENELNELRDEFQNRTSEQFEQQLRELRNEAQDLELKEEGLAQQLQARDTEADNRAAAPAGLREPQIDRGIERELEQQARRVEQLREDMKRTIQNAEEAEPLLAEELYETYRQSERRPPDQALDSAARSLANGFTRDAVREEEIGRAGIADLREGLEQAAESILGDESRALEAARDRLEQLRRELEQEIERNSPSTDTEQGTDRNGETGSTAGNDSDNPPLSRSEPEDREPGNRGDRSDESGAGDNQTPNENSSPGGNPSETEEGTGRAGGAGEPDSDARDGRSGRGGSDEANAAEGEPSGGNRDSADRPATGSQSGNQPERAGEPGRGQPTTGGGDPNLNDRDASPLTGDEFLDWMDRLRDVESMVPDAQLRGEASRIRERAREFRKEYRRHSKDPNWDLVRMQLAQPLAELQRAVTEELIRRTVRDARVPLDRDAVPARYRNLVDRYFEEVGN